MLQAKILEQKLGINKRESERIINEKGINGPTRNLTLTRFEARYPVYGEAK